jgi:hypothetical protein
MVRFKYQGEKKKENHRDWPMGGAIAPVRPFKSALGNEYQKI